MNDPIVDEIRKIRDAHAARFNYDLKAIYEDIKRSEKDREEKTGRKFVAPPRRHEPSAAPHVMPSAMSLPVDRPLPEGGALTNP